MNANSLLVRRYIEEIVNTGNLEKIAEFISEEYVEVYNDKRNPTGIEGAMDHIRSVRRNYKDLFLTITLQVAEGDYVATQYVMTGIHHGNWLGMKSTGKHLTITGVNIDKVVNGKIVEHGGAANMMESLLEIGALVIA